MFTNFAILGASHCNNVNKKIRWHLTIIYRMMWSPRACLEMISDACRLRSIQSSPRWGNMSLCGVRAFIRWQKGALTAGIVKKWWNFKGPIMMGLPFPYYSYAIPTFETSTVWEDVWKWGPISQRVTVHLPRWDTHSQLRKFTMLLVVVLANIRGYFYNNPTISNNIGLSVRRRSGIKP